MCLVKPSSYLQLQIKQYKVKCQESVWKISANRNLCWESQSNENWWTPLQEKTYFTSVFGESWKELCWVFKSNLIHLPKMKISFNVHPKLPFLVLFFPLQYGKEPRESQKEGTSHPLLPWLLLHQTQSFFTVYNAFILSANPLAQSKCRLCCSSLRVLKMIPADLVSRPRSVVLYPASFTVIMRPKGWLQKSPVKGWIIFHLVQQIC